MIFEFFHEFRVDFGHGLIHSRYTQINATLEDAPITWNFNKNYTTEINDREHWDATLTNTTNTITWFSDGSKSEVGTGSGAYCETLDINISKRLSDHATIMQAETIAIQICVEEMISQAIKGKNIFIFSDSQAAIKALTHHIIKANTVRECSERLNLLGSENTVRISWVPGHEGITGNETADKLAKEGTELQSINIETPTPSNIIYDNIQTASEALQLKEWNGRSDLLHTKRMIKPTINKNKQLVGLNKKDLRVIIGLITGHGCLNKYLYRIGATDDSTCRFCLEEEEEMWHILTECPALATIRISVFSRDHPSSSCLQQMNHLELLKFAKKTGLYETFFKQETSTPTE
jgi:ribonuclease HI